MTNAALKTPAVPEDQHRGWRETFNTQAPSIAREQLPSPTYALPDRLFFGARGEWVIYIKPPRVGAWEKKITGASSPIFSAAVASWFNETEAEGLARLLRWENGNGKAGDRNRLKHILVGPEGDDREWLDRWEKGQHLPGSRTAKRLNASWRVQVSFAGDTSHVLRSGDQDQKLYSLHRDALTDVPVGLSVRGPGLSTDISFGNLTAPIKLHEGLEQQLFLARDLRTGLKMIQSHKPTWIVPNYENIELPKGVRHLGLAVNAEAGDRALIQRLRPIYASRGVSVVAIEPENSARWDA